ncbi:hypothetical protein AwDysgo_17310 [Bacteroidales bacterium]|nr:hypothetical protein AwDysgo_17310 [Bacteroidales bacterium]
MNDPLEIKPVVDSSIEENKSLETPTNAVESDLAQVEAVQAVVEAISVEEILPPLEPLPIVGEVLSEETSAIPLVEASIPKEEVEASPVVEGVSPDRLSPVELVERLSVLVQGDAIENVRKEVDQIKLSFYKIRKSFVDKLRKNFLAEGGQEVDFLAPIDELEERLKVFLQTFKEKKAVLKAEDEKNKEKNLEAKKGIIEQLKNLIESQDDFYKVHQEFRRLQQVWKDIKHIPQASVNDIWKEYQLHTEKFYDLLKINNEMRDYDFRKNLELKLVLCDNVEKLAAEPDVMSAFYQLQKFHQDWREIGPVSRELRDEIWDRFKNASTVVNKRHQDHFDVLRDAEQKNLEEKTLICEELEGIDCTALLAFRAWEEKSKRVFALQEQWKHFGFAPKKQNIKIFERYRSACDVFFQKKSDFFKHIKQDMDVNLEKKKELCEKVEAFKDSENWKEASEQFVALQREWKTIGAVSRKYSDSVWKRFIGACDHFFERKNTHFASQKGEEQENMILKKDIIEKVKALDTSLNANQAIAELKQMMSQWNAVGFVPFKEKDKLYKEYKEAVDSHFDRLKVDESERRLQSFRSNINAVAGGERSQNKLLGERERLMRTHDHLKGDIQTYENNMGFLSVSSKDGGGLVKEMTRKIDNLKSELDLIVKKIDMIDNNLDQEK